MRATATSLLVRGESPGRLVSSIREAAASWGSTRPAGGLVLAAGGMATKLGAAADALAEETEQTGALSIHDCECLGTK